jgi:hypothetical protein
VTPKKVAEDDLLQQLYEAHRELDEAHAAAREASRRLQEVCTELAQLAADSLLIGHASCIHTTPGAL